jgi:hypothetical protein
MRQLVWIAMFAVFTIPAAYAQSNSGTKAGAYDVGAPGQPPPALKADPLTPGNCGTPDDAKPCPPMPKRALKHYPAKPKNG